MNVLAGVGTAVAAVVLAATPAITLGEAPQLSAESLGISVEEVDERGDWQNEVGVSLAGLTEAYPDDYAWSELTREGPAVATIWFKGDVPVDAMAFFSTVRSTVHIVLRGDYGLNENEMADLGWQANVALRATGSFEHTVSGFDPARRQLIVEVNPRPDVLPEQAKDIALQAINTLPAEFRDNAVIHISDNVRSVPLGGGAVRT